MHYSTTQNTISSKFYLRSEKEARQDIISNRAELEELQDTGDRVKRWIKRYSNKRPQFA